MSGGGDDLGGFDEEEDYLDIRSLPQSKEGDDSDGDEDDDDDVKNTPSRKRQRDYHTEDPEEKKKEEEDEDEDDDEEDHYQSSSHKRQKQQKKKMNLENLSGPRLLREASRGIAEESAEAQAAFLNACLRQYGSKVEGEEKEEEKEESPRSFQAFHFHESIAGRTNNRIDRFLTTAVSSVSFLRKWKKRGSPMVLIVCLSARRAVSLLKDAAPLQVRAAKLFAKHLTVEQQVEILRQAPGLAVGTPHRLRQLAATKALLLESTQLVVLDSWHNEKDVGVCTMNDTAPEMAQFLQEVVLPQLSTTTATWNKKQRKKQGPTLRVAFL